MVMIVTGMMMTGMIPTMTGLMRMTIIATTINEMSATKVVQQTLIANGVFVNAIMVTRKSMVDVKATGVGFHKHKFNSTDQPHSILSSLAVVHLTACPWI